MCGSGMNMLLQCPLFCTLDISNVHPGSDKVACFLHCTKVDVDVPKCFPQFDHMKRKDQRNKLHSGMEIEQHCWLHHSGHISNGQHMHGKHPKGSPRLIHVHEVGSSSFEQSCL